MDIIPTQDRPNPDLKYEPGFDLKEGNVFTDNGYCLTCGSVYFTEEQIVRLEEVYECVELSEYTVGKTQVIKRFRFVRRDPLNHERYDGSVFNYEEYLNEDRH